VQRKQHDQEMARVYPEAGAPVHIGRNRHTWHLFPLLEAYLQPMVLSPLQRGLLGPLAPGAAEPVIEKEGHLMPRYPLEV
jgi:hypothetical protein